MEEEIKNERKAKKVVVVNEGSSGFVRLLKVVLILGVVLTLVGIGTAIGTIYYFKKDLPTFESVDQYKPLLGTMVYAEDGTKIGEFAIEKRQIVEYEKIPRLLILAYVAAEDQNFFMHFGFDPIGMLRAMMSNVQAGHFKQGASTITMQLARTFFLSREKKLVRKIREIILAIFEIEANLTKEEILWLYLNQIYLGHGAYGVQQASRTYFDKNVWELDLAEMAVLAGLPKAPGRDSPFVNMPRATKRKNYVLRRMYEAGYITKAEREEAENEPIRLTEQINHFLAYAPHFTEHVRKYLYDKYGEKALYSGGLHVQTTLNVEAQKYAQDAMYHGLRSLDHREGYRGPLAHLPKDKWNVFLRNLERHYAGLQLQRNRRYYGLVTDVSDKKETVTVQVGQWVADIPLETMRWARKPNPEVYWANQQIKRPSWVLKAGDVIMVRPTDLKHAFDTFDHRSQMPLEMKKLIWVLEQEPIAQSAILAKEPESGYTVAMVGGYQFEKSEFNRAIQACRQPGSAFKPIVYAAALDGDWNVSTIIMDSPIVDGEWKWKWKPENYGEDFQGEVSLRYALQHSLNIPAIKTIDHVGVLKVKHYAEKLGVRTEIQEDRSISLGSACMTPEDLVNAYAHFVNGGRKPGTVYVKTVIDPYGNILEDNRVYYDIGLDFVEKLDRMEQEVLTVREQVIPETTAFLTAWLLTEVVNGGTGAGAKALGRPCGGKTGTTNDNYDAWFSGFTPSLVAAAWIGHDDNWRPLGKLETGGRAALPIWLDFMKNTLKDTPVEEFEAPEGIHWLRVDQKTGRLATDSTALTVKAPFKVGTQPAESMPENTEINPDEFFKMGEIY